jgi:hypothetical protein
MVACAPAIGFMAVVTLDDVTIAATRTAAAQARAATRQRLGHPLDRWSIAAAVVE